MPIAIITGASSGLGREFAVQIAKRYRTLDEIWLIARTQAKLEETAKQFDSLVPAKTICMDLTQSDACKILNARLSRENPSVGLLVNAAGYGMIGDFTALPTQANTGMVALNAQALTAVTHTVLPYMCKNARIINVASAAAFLPQPGFAVYAATKAYVLHFSKALRAELKKRRIAVTAVCPGPVDTDFFSVAETYYRRKAYKRLFMAKPKRVVSRALIDAYHRRPLSIYGSSMRALYRVSKWLR